MRTITAATLSLMITATRALASAQGATEGMGTMATFFIGFGVLIIVFQFVPGIMLLAGILKGIFAKARKPGEVRRTE